MAEVWGYCSICKKLKKIGKGSSVELGVKIFGKHRNCNRKICPGGNLPFVNKYLILEL